MLGTYPDSAIEISLIEFIQALDWMDELPRKKSQNWLKANLKIVRAWTSDKFAPNIPVARGLKVGIGKLKKTSSVSVTPL